MSGQCTYLSSVVNFLNKSTSWCQRDCFTHVNNMCRVQGTLTVIETRAVFLGERPAGTGYSKLGSHITDLDKPCNYGPTFLVNQDHG